MTEIAPWTRAEAGSPARFADAPPPGAAPEEETPLLDGVLAAFARPLRADATFGGSGQPDTLTGGADADRLTGRGGADRLAGGGGRDTLEGGGGKDTLLGGSGADLLKGGGGADSLDGGGGKDTLEGGAGKDVLKGKGGRDDLSGGGGGDTLEGGGGKDTLTGGKGSDLLVGGGGADLFRFSAADFAAPAMDVIADFTPGADKVSLSGFSGIDSFLDLDFVATTEGAALELGAGRRIVFRGLDAADLSAADFGLPAGPLAGGTKGGAGADTLQGGPGNDSIDGGGGNDVIGTSAGADTLRGGTGADTFVVRLLNGAIDPAFDRVADFQFGFGDKVSFTEALAGVAFDEISEVVRATPQAGGTMIAVDRGGGFVNALFLEGVSFTLADLATYGFVTPARSAAAFDPNPYGFTNQTNTVADPSVTPDGRFAVWVDKGNRDGFAGDPDPRALDEFGNVIEEASMDVFVINTATGAAMRVTEAARDGSAFFAHPGDFNFAQFYSPDLSADGRFVFFATNADAFGATPDNNNGAFGFFGPGDIYRRDMLNPDADPVLVTRLSAPDPSGNFAVGGVPAPDFGAAFNTASPPVLAVSDSGDRVVFVTAGNGFFGERTSGQAVFGGVRHEDPNFGTDVYVREISTGRTFLVTGVTFDDGSETVRTALGGVPESYPSGGFFKAPGVGISGDGKIVVYVTRTQFSGEDEDDAMDVYAQNIETGQTVLVSRGLATDAFSPTISRDGTKIAFGFEKVAGGEDFAIRVATLDRAAMTVTVGPNLRDTAGRQEFMPVLSPDGNRLAYLSTDNGAFDFDPSLRVVTLATGAETALPYLGDTHGNVDFLGPGFANYDLSDGGAVYRTPETTGEESPFGGALVFGDRIVFEEL